MRETLLFYWQIARRWRTTGAIAPSGGNLARAMAHAVGEITSGQVILELGPGTGVFTREVMPFLAMICFIILLLTFTPGIVLWLPNMLM